MKVACKNCKHLITEVNEVMVDIEESDFEYKFFCRASSNTSERFHPIEGTTRFVSFEKCEDVNHSGDCELFEERVPWYRLIKSWLKKKRS
jgi:hypothetical protein